MFTKKEKPKYQRMLEDELESQIRTLKSHVTGSEDYIQTLSCIERMHPLMGDEKPSRINPETRATIAANLIGIILILKHENVNVITSKALSFVTRLR
jgi:hypothetical protein